MNDYQRVFRDRLKEHRGDYFVTYQPAQAGLPFACITLVYPQDVGDLQKVKDSMGRELELWVKRYPVPVMVSAFDAKDDLIRVDQNRDGPHLMGYLESDTGNIVQRWGLLKNSELPPEQLNEDYQKRVYRDIPFRTQAEVAEQAYRKFRKQGKATRAFLVFIVGTPVLIEIVALGVSWFGHLLAGISISIGSLKVSRAMGWIKPSEREKVKAEKQLKMEHYFYHCERNPETFNRLKAENFERDAINDARRESESIRRGIS